MTWEMVDETAKQLGLGEPTGIELVEKTGYRNTPERKKEVYKTGADAAFGAGDRVLGAIGQGTGYRNTPERKKEVYKTGADAAFGAGDRVLGAIGQGENRFTPLQLCVYASTLANKGTRMKATFLSRVVSSDYRTLILDNEPQIVSQAQWAPTTIEHPLAAVRVRFHPGQQGYPDEGNLPQPCGVLGLPHPDSGQRAADCFSGAVGTHHHRKLLAGHAQGCHHRRWYGLQLLRRL